MARFTEPSEFGAVFANITTECSMADDRNLNERYEVQYWTSKWRIRDEQLTEAVRKVGPMSAAVAKALGKEL